MPDPVMYTELADKWFLEQTETGWNGLRVFIRDNGGSIAEGFLPVVNESVMLEKNGVTEVEGCLCRAIKERYESGHAGSLVLECRYSTTGFSSRNAGLSAEEDYQAASFDLGLTLESVLPNPNPPDGDYWQWGSSVEVDQELPIVMPNGRVEITFPQELDEDLRDLLLARVSEYRGSINNATFWGHPAGQVMFLGISGGGTYRDADNAVKYRVTFSFQFRTIPPTLKDAGADTKDWLYVFSSKHGKYKKPVTNVGGKYLYQEKNFTDLFAVVVAPVGP